MGKQYLSEEDHGRVILVWECLTSSTKVENSIYVNTTGTEKRREQHQTRGRGEVDKVAVLAH